MARNEDVYLAASGFEMLIPMAEMMGAEVVEVIKEDNLISYRVKMESPSGTVIMTLAVFSEGEKDES